MTSFGKDTSCTTSLRTGRFATGARLVGEAAFRRLTTPRGKLRGGEEEANYGLDLYGLVGTNATKADAAALPGRISSELEKDPRIQAATVGVLTTTVGPYAAFQITIEAITSEGPFTLQIGINDVDVTLLGLTAEVA